MSKQTWVCKEDVFEHCCARATELIEVTVRVGGVGLRPAVLVHKEQVVDRWTGVAAMLDGGRWDERGRGDSAIGE